MPGQPDNPPGAPPGRETPRRIGWSHSSRFSSVQDRVGITPRDEIRLPPATERVTQSPDPYNPRYLDEREVLRVTYQGDDRCQLACPGCYTGERLRGPTNKPARKKVVAHERYAEHLTALGDGLADVFLLGAEPTMDPTGSAAKLSWASERGLPVMSITHGAVSVERFEGTFGEALESGLYKLIVSLDSMDAEVNNRLRGRSYAHDRTLTIIRHCVERGVPLKVQTTVWPYNYSTVLASTHQLFELGVRGFAFHAGSLEGVSEPERHGLEHIHPLAWRVLAEQLLRFRDQHLEQLRQFNVPFLYYTEDELADHVIGDHQLTREFVAHLDAVDRGEPSVKPVHACPALDVPQVYVFANDGPSSAGTASICNIHAPDGAAAYADYEPESKRFVVRANPATNQLQHMIDSPHLCPATEMATGRGTRYGTEAEPLFHACRYLASNQVPIEPSRFGDQTYSDAVEYYDAVRMALDAYPNPAPDGEWPLQRIHRVSADPVRLTDRAALIRADLGRV